MTCSGAKFFPPRSVTDVLNVTNGAESGHYRREEFCPEGTYATGFQLKVSSDQA